MLCRPLYSWPVVISIKSWTGATGRLGRFHSIVQWRHGAFAIQISFSAFQYQHPDRDGLSIAGYILKPLSPHGSSAAELSNM